ncbi:MAG: hypothetical protein ACYTG0_24640 [Planctomycetota bacterium]|jgi:hypothetical protein
MRSLCKTLLIVRVGLLIVVAFSFGSAMAADPKPEVLMQSYANAGAKLQNAQAGVINACAGWIQAISNVRKIQAETLKGLQELRSKRLDNELKTAQTFFTKRERRDQYVSAHPRVRPNLETYVKVCNAAKPARLCTYQYDPDRGVIHWPELLQGLEFEDERAELDALFALNTTKGLDSGPQFRHQIDRLSRKMRETLKGKVHDVSQMQYIASKKFLTGLAYEARFAPQLSGVAAAH